MKEEDQLRKITTDSQRALTKRPRPGKMLDILTSMDADLTNVKVYGGFGYFANNVIPELQKGRVVSPPGLIVSASTYHGCQIFRFDFYKGILDVSKEQYGLDRLINKYRDTLTTSTTFLLDGQSEETIIASIPYINTFPSIATRTASPYGYTPGEPLPPNPDDWVKYPDDWPTVSVFPQVQESVWMTYASLNMYWTSGDFYIGNVHETFRLPYTANGEKIGGRRSFFEQWIGSFAPSATTYPLPVTGGISMVRPVNFLYYPFDTDTRYFATTVTRPDGVFQYNRVPIADILPLDPSPATDPLHTGDYMPEALRTIFLTDNTVSARPLASYVFSLEPDRKPVLVHLIDMTATDNPCFSSGDDDDWLEDPVNVDERRWKISVHWNDTETGETWSYTASQFWTLLETLATNSTLTSDWKTAPADNLSGTTSDGWEAAKNMTYQFFGMPNYIFSVPHDTVTFHAADGNIYAWTRTYGVIQITKTGIFEYTGAFFVPQVVTDNDGVRPTIRYSGTDTELGVSWYICVAEDLEEPRAVHGIFIGSPFTGWTEIPSMPEVDPEAIEPETGFLCHVRPVFHKLNEDLSESLLLLGIFRRVETVIDPETFVETEETVYFPCNLSYNSLTESFWKITGKLTGLNPIDPDHADWNPTMGERVSWDLGLFGDRVLSPQMMKYPSQPYASSQLSCIPYADYVTGLP